jgi:hypothetical protein
LRLRPNGVASTSMECILTIICIKDGAVAADGSTWDGPILVSTTTRKLVQSLDFAIGGAAGDSSCCEKFRDWFVGTSSRHDRMYGDRTLVFTKDDSFSAIWLNPDGGVWRLDWNGRAYPLTGQPFATIGGPAQMAYGAMAAGASAEEAVRICARYHDCAGGETLALRLLEPPPAEDHEQMELIEQPPDFPTQNDEWRERMGLA